MTRLECWAIKKVCGPYQAPEQSIFCLVGRVYDHPSKSHYDGRRVITSMIENSNKEDRTVTTYSGTVYKLGEPDPNWLNWLKEQGKPHGQDVFPFDLD